MPLSLVWPLAQSLLHLLSDLFLLAAFVGPPPARGSPKAARIFLSTLSSAVYDLGFILSLHGLVELSRMHLYFKQDKISLPRRGRGLSDKIKHEWVKKKPFQLWLDWKMSHLFPSDPFYWGLMADRKVRVEEEQETCASVQKWVGFIFLCSHDYWGSSMEMRLGPEGTGRECSLDPLVLLGELGRGVWALEPSPQRGDLLPVAAFVVRAWCKGPLKAVPLQMAWPFTAVAGEFSHGTLLGALRIRLRVSSF